MAAQMARAASDQGDRHGTGAAEERSCKTRRQTFSTRPAGAGSKILPLRRMLWPLRLHHRLDLTARNQASKIFGPADEHAFDENHREALPARPHLERGATTPSAEIAAIFQIEVRDLGGVERFACLARKRILLHAYHDDIVRRDGSLHFADDVDV